MATLVLTTVGTLVGGPVGGAVGALIGNRIDGTLLGQGGRRGPRLGDLAVQTSSYGTVIPKLFGRIRVAGTVIWVTDLKEAESRSGGGKGRPKTTGYSYSASFAVALSARTARSIGRIWADGILLRGATGDWKGTTGFRFHDGREGQPVDPLIAACEGIGRTPAFAGIAYVVFEDLQLAPYGNRIPSLSFEVEANDGPVTVGAIAAILSDGAVADASATQVSGYAASGDSVRGAIEALAAATSAVLVDDGTRLTLREGGTAATQFPGAALGSAAGERGGVRREMDRRAAGTVPDEVSIAYYEFERDYQTGLQRARWSGPGRRVRAMELPAVLPAAAAKRIVERRLAEDWAARREAVIRLPWRWMTVRPGQAVTVSGSREGWRVAEVSLDRMVVQLRLVGTAPVASGERPAVAGRATMQRDAPHGSTTIRLFELPPGAGRDEGPTLYVAAAGSSAGWRQAVLEGSLNDGMTVEAIGRSAPAAVIGQVQGTVPAAGSMLFDDVTRIEVLLLNDAMRLEGRSDAAMMAGANLALVGEELIQFGRAEQIGAARYRLSRLLRERRGTEAAITTHLADEGFVLVEPDRLVAMRIDSAAIGVGATVLARGVGDAVPVEATWQIRGAALRPLCPVHLRVRADDDGDLLVSWIRRSRSGWAWSDGVDVPIGEEFERYRVSVATGGRVVRVVEVSEPMWRYEAALQEADGLGLGGGTIAVTQVGTAAQSLATTIGITEGAVNGDG